MRDLCPVDKDDNELIWQNSLRRRESQIHWSTASGCHFNCVSPGSGVRLVVSRGKRSRSSIQLCQPDKYVSWRIINYSIYFLLRTYFDELNSPTFLLCRVVVDLRHHTNKRHLFARNTKSAFGGFLDLECSSQLLLVTLNHATYIVTVYNAYIYFRGSR